MVRNMKNSTLTMHILFICMVFLMMGQCISGDLDIDSDGYVLYCPCMGRFGNQADQFLGALSFAHALNRTLVLPPWVEYRRGERNSVQVPFDTYFKVEPLKEYTKVMTMEKFMKDLAPMIWPEDKRIAYCYSSRSGGKAADCNAKDGNPFGPFWDTFNIDFVGSEFYGPLSYSMHSKNTVKQWTDRYPPKKHLVLAFTGTPGSFPVNENDVPLQRYLKWSDAINAQADIFIEENLSHGPFLAIHMRNGIDWTRACDHIGADSKRNMFGSANCLGYRLEHGALSKNLCNPPDAIVIKQVKHAVKKLRTKTVFVATDDRDMISEFKKAMKKVKFLRLPESSPHVDLAIIGKADHAIVNCVSTFSAFAVRERRSNEKSVDFWAFNVPEGNVENDVDAEQHEEL